MIQKIPERTPATQAQERTGLWTREKHRGRLLAPKHNRNKGGLQEQAMMLHAKGLSVSEISDALLRHEGVFLSKEAVEDMLERVMPGLSAWQSGRLAPQYERVFIIELIAEVKQGKELTHKRAYALLGIESEGCGEALGLWLTENPHKQFWEAVFLELQDRGLLRISFLVGVESRGVASAGDRVFPGTMIQPCTLYSQASCLLSGKSKKKKEMSQCSELAYDECYRSVNAEQSFYKTLLKATRTRHPFPNDEAILKALFWRIIEWKALL